MGVVHSMRGGTASPDWPRLGLADVDTALWAVGIDAAGAVLEWHSERPLSSAGIVNIDGRKLFVKRHDRRVRRASDLEEEHAFMGHLRAHGGAVTRVLQAPDGRSALAIGSWTYEIHEVASGVDAYRDAQSWTPFASPAHGFAAGRALAELHRAAQAFLAPPRRAAMLVSNDRLIGAADPVEALAAELPLRPALADYLAKRPWQIEVAQALAPFHACYRRSSKGLARVWTHNDWHASNLLWSHANPTAHVTAVIDFGLCDCTTRIFDLATAIERNTIPWLDIQEGRSGSADLELVTALLAGYLDCGELAARERHALVAILPLVHVGYALSEIEYFHGITHSADNAALAYDAFLLGHCRWFTEPEGRDLLLHLQTMLAVSI